MSANASSPGDTGRFLDLLQRRRSHPAAAVRQVFESVDEVHVARAPGRLDVMGGIADYSGSLVLQWPMQEATHVALALTPEPSIRIVSVLEAEVRAGDVPLAVLAPGGVPASYESARAWFAADPEHRWTAYVAGAWLVLARERGLAPSGARVLVYSDVPEGKGVSSSAALEAAVMSALLQAQGRSLPVREASLLCQRVENLVAGAPCGIMDQVSVIGGEAGRLLALLCQPAELRGTVALPPELALWGIDSGIRHAVSGSDYVSVRVGAFMGYRVLAELAGLEVRAGDRPGHVRVVDPRWSGHLANVGVDGFASFDPRLPPALAGAAFLERYGGTTDAVTTVDPARTYAVRIPARHPVHEHARVSTWHDRLVAREGGGGATRDVAREIGALMYESHASYSACGLGSEGTDLLVALAREAGAERGIHGAKITGGGSGGTVALLTDADAGPAVHAIAARYRDLSGRGGRVFSGSSSGAAAFGGRRVPLRGL